MVALRLPGGAVVVPELVAAARTSTEYGSHVVQVLMPMGSAWVTVWSGESESIGDYQRSAQLREQAAEVLRFLVDAMSDSTVPISWAFADWRGEP